MITAEEFKREVASLASEIGVDAKEIHLRHMKRKLASCSSKGRLTFDTSLLEQPREFRLDVVLHELLHLRYPKHNRMFKAMLDAYLRQPYVSAGRQAEGDL